MLSKKSQLIMAKPGYYLSNHCVTCRAKDRAGNPMRDWIDNQKDEGVSTPKLVARMREEGVLIQQPNMDKHFRNHSPWIAQKRHDLAKARLDNITKVDRQADRNAEEELQKLINVGGDRVDTGEIVVDKDLYMFAIDRQTRNKQPFSIQSLVMNFGDALTRKEPMEEVKVVENGHS